MNKPVGKKHPLAEAEAVIECIAAYVDACATLGIKPSALSFKTGVYRNFLESQATTLAASGNPMAKKYVVKDPGTGKTLIAGLKLEVSW